MIHARAAVAAMAAEGADTGAAPLAEAFRQWWEWDYPGNTAVGCGIPEGTRTIT